MASPTPKTPPTPAQAAPWLVLLALGSIYFIWGSTYVGIRVAIDTLPPFFMAGTRFVVAGALLYAWQRGRGVRSPTRRQWRAALIIGALMLVGGNGGVTFAEQYVPSSLAALVVAAVPIWAVLLDWLLFDGPRPTRIMWLGLVGGLAGVAFLIGPGEFGGERIEPIGVIALLTATLTWATGSLISRRAELPREPLMATGAEMLAGGALLFVAGLINGEATALHLDRVSTESALALLYLTLIGSLVAFTAYQWLLRNTTPARATSYAYVNPVVAVFLGWALASEPVTLHTLAGAAIIITAVMVITSARAQAQAAPSPPESPVESPELAHPQPAQAGK